MYIKGFSPSKLNVFDECEQKYRYKYIHYLPEEYNEGLSTDALQFGSYIHKILEDGVDAESVEELMEHATRLRNSYQFEGREADIVKCVRNFLKFNQKLTDSARATRLATISATRVIPQVSETDIPVLLRNSTMDTCTADRNPPTGKTWPPAIIRSA